MTNAWLRTSTGSPAARLRDTTAGIWEKARMKLTKYSASGSTHKSGTGAMSVDKEVVTPSNRLDGTKASASQRSRWLVVGAGPSAAWANCGVPAAAGDRQT